jgi:hypothetical protein
MSNRIDIQTNVPLHACACSSKKSAAVPGSIHNHFIIGGIQTSAGTIPRIASHLQRKDYLGALRVRCGIKRDQYRVNPGLYAVGTPDEHSDILVTANYKLTFDIVRKNLKGIDAWLLVVDTRGVNVWCAAGKGTFGTKELVYRIQATSLSSIVKHKRLILPQLGATGVAAHLVKENSGYTVLYGPVRISDIQSFIQAGYKATKEMRRVNFGFYDRLKLIPNDISYNLRYLLSLFAVLSLLSGITAHGYSVQQVLRNLFPITKIISAGYFAGLIFTPLLLPYIPSRSFSLKGIILGLLASFFLYLNHSLDGSLLTMAGEAFIIIGFSSFLAMNFTGTSTFTSLAGVKKEMRTAVPLQILFAVLGVILFALEITIEGK